MYLEFKKLTRPISMFYNVEKLDAKSEEDIGLLLCKSVLTKSTLKYFLGYAESRKLR